MVIDLKLNEEQINRYRQIALDYLYEIGMTLYIRPQNGEFVFLLDDLTDESSEIPKNALCSYYNSDNKFGSIEEAKGYVNEDFLPDLGLVVQQEKTKQFQMLV